MRSWSQPNLQQTPETASVDLTQRGLVCAGKVADVAEEGVSVRPGQCADASGFVHQSVGVAQDREVSERHAAAHDGSGLHGLHGCERVLPGRQCDTGGRPAGCGVDRVVECGLAGQHPCLRAVVRGSDAHPVHEFVADVVEGRRFALPVEIGA